MNMKTRFTYNRCLFIPVVFLLLLTEYSYSQTATTNAATNVQATSAQLNGEVSGSSIWYDITFRWESEDTYSSGFTSDASSQSITSSGNDGIYTFDATSLTQGKIYYFRIEGTDDGFGTNYGSTLSFTTPNPGIVVTSLSVSNFSATTATFSATYDSGTSTSGGITQQKFEWGETDSYGNSYTLSGGNAIGDCPFTKSYSISGLIAGTTYHYRASGYSTEYGTTYYGDDVTFTTIDYPSVTSMSAQNITSTTADARGTVTDNGDGTVSERGVVYNTSGTTPEIGESGNTKEQALAGGTGGFTVALSSLSSSVTHYYRAYAINEAGTSYGDLQTFDTDASSPEMNVTGNGSSITDGDETPSTTDNTDLGTTTSIAISKMFTIENSGDAELTLSSSPKVYISGTNADLFSVDQPSSPVAASGGTSTFTITFDPDGSTGIKEANVIIDNDDTDENPYNFAIKATAEASTPDVSVTSVTFSNTGSTSIQINWTGGNGDATIVAIREGDQGTIIDPTNSTTYTASTDWSSLEDQLGSSGYYVVYNGSGTNVTVSNLSAATTYYVAAYEYNGSSGAERYNINEATANQTTLKAAPTTQAANVEFSQIYSSTLSITWDNGGSCDAYLVVGKYGANPTAPTSGISYSANSVFAVGDITGNSSYVVYRGTGTSVNVTGLEANKTYYFKVYQFNNTTADDEEYNISDEINNPNNQTTSLSAPTPSATSNIEATSFTANWSVVSGAVEYVLDVGTSDGGIDILNGASAGTNTYYNISGLIAGTTYYYLIRAINSSGNPSDNSSSISVKTKCSAPTANVASSITVSSFQANWTAPSGGTPDNYKLDVATNNSFTSYVTGYEDKTVSGISDAVTSLTTGTTFYYRIRAVNASGTSANSATITVATTPDAPVAIDATDNESSQFTANWNSVSGASSYSLEVCVASDNFSPNLAAYNNIDVGDVTSYTVSGLSNNTTYKYRVWVDIEGSSSTYSNEISQKTTPPPPDPTDIGATNIKSTSFTANWSDKSANGATSYLLDVSEAENFSSYVTGYEEKTVTGVYSFNVTGLDAETTYYYRVRSVNGSGTTGGSSEYLDSPEYESVTTALPAPTASAATSVSASGFSANWGAVSGATTYYLDISEASDFSSFITGYENTDVGNVTSDAITGLSRGTTYYYRVRASDGTNSSSNSNTISAITLCAAPTATAASSVTPGSFQANWDATTGATSYELDVATDNSFSAYVSGYEDLDVGINTSLSVSGLDANTTYYYRVRAVNATGTSNNSNTINTTTSVGTYTKWTGTVSTVWNLANNWTNGIPGSTTDVSITPTTNKPAISSAAECNSLTIDATATLTVNDGYTLTVNGELTNNGEMSLKSSTSGPAGSLIDNGTVSGSNFAVQRYLEAATGGHFISLPVANSSGTTVDQVFPTTNRAGVWSFDESGSGTLAWNTLASSYQLQDKQGYYIRYDNGGDATAEFDGEINTGIFTFNVTKTNYGWNFIGNPYPSALDWDAVDNSSSDMSNINLAIHYYDADAANYNIYLRGTTYGGTTSLTNGSRYIPAMQGFMVQCNDDTGGYIVLRNSQRVHNSPSFYKSGETDLSDGKLRLTVSNSSYKDETLIRFLEHATDDFDPSLDAHKLFSPVDAVPQMYTIMNNDEEEYAINSLLSDDMNETIPLGIKIGEAGEYTLKVTEYSFDDDISVYLEDELMDESINLDKQDEYVFVSDVLNNTERFKIVFSTEVITEIDDELNGIKNLNLYANSNLIYIINNSGETIDANIAVFDILGRQVLTENASISGTYQLETNNLQGAYVVRIRTNKGTFSKKVIL